MMQQESVELSSALDYDSCYAAIVHGEDNEKCVCPRFNDMFIVRTA
jgi:hypothetical protein